MKDTNSIQIEISQELYKELTKIAREKRVFVADVVHQVMGAYVLGHKR